MMHFARDYDVIFSIKDFLKNRLCSRLWSRLEALIAAEGYFFE